MRRFFCRLPVWILVLAELMALTWILTMSAHVIHIKDDITGKIVDDGQEHAVGYMPLPHTVEPKVEVPDPPEEDPDGGETDPGGEGDPGGGEDDPGGMVEIVPGGLPESERVDTSYFDDVVFIGDSVSLKLQYYVRDQRKSDENFLGTAQFLTAGSFSYINALKPVSEDSVHPSYQGTKMLLEDSIAASGARKLYIMLGMNDIAGGRYDGTLANLTTVISRILEKSPDVIFYFQSVTPRMEDSQTTKLNNEIIRSYNERLLQYCEENGYYFIDVYAALCDENGNLPAEYCSDPKSLGGMGIHFTNTACAAWLDYLYTHTA